MKAHIFALLLTIGTFAAGASGCTRSEPEPKPGPAPLAVQLSSEPVSLDPALAEDGISLRILANTMEGLVGYDAQGNLQNRLAESVEVTPDRKSYTFKLRQTARWSDGMTLSPEQFVEAFRRSLAPDSVSKLAPLLGMIRGADKYRKGEIKPAELGVSARNGALLIELERPASHFLHALTLPIAYPIRKDILAVNAGKWPITAPGTGPYTIHAYTPDRKILLRRNAHYYLPPAGPENVEFVVVNDESTSANLLEQGKLDIVTKLPLTDLARIKASGRLRTDPYYATYFLAFNTRKPPFNDAAARRAFSLAIDREGIISILQSGEKSAYWWIPPGLEGGDLALPAKPPTPPKVVFDPQFPVIAVFDSGTRNSLILQKVQQDVQEKLGLKLELQNTDWKSHIRAMQTDAPQVYRFGWQAPFRDPISHLRAFTTTDPNNYTGWANARYDQLVDEIEALEPGAERMAKIAEAQSILVEKEAAVVPLYHYVQTHGVSKRVQGFQANPFGMIFFRELKVTD